MYGKFISGDRYRRDAGVAKRRATNAGVRQSGVNPGPLQLVAVLQYFNVLYKCFVEYSWSMDAILVFVKYKVVRFRRVVYVSYLNFEF